MIDRVIEWSARNVALVVLLVGAIAAAGLWAVRTTPLDAIPDLSDVQVIVYTEFPGQAPQVVEDQVTYKLTTALLTVPHSRVVRGFSNFGVSYVYVVFDDGTDLYWARSRVLEYLNTATKQLPAGVAPTIGPDATGVGWVWQYAITGPGKDLGELRAIQDWQARFALSKAPGIAEVASVGGFVQTYQVTVDPARLRAYGLSLAKVMQAIRESNRDVGGRVIELAEAEYMVRGAGYLRSVADLQGIAVMAADGTPVRLADVARIELAPDERRGIAELNGTGEVASGIAMQRQGEDTLSVIDGVKAKAAAFAASLPEGVRLETVYDRSDLIRRAIGTLERTLIEESIVVALVCFVFLLHARSALVAIVTLPVGVLLTFLGMRVIGVGSNIMSLGGIAIALGAMVDAAIVMIENAHKRLEQAEPGADRVRVLIGAAREVGPALFFSLAIITVSFLPVFALEAQEGRLFRPLALTKSFAMAAGALLSVTLVPALMLVFVRGRIRPEAQNPINRALIWIYRPAIRWVLSHRGATIVIALLMLIVTSAPASRLGSEFMPNLDEGTLMYMPVSLPGLSAGKAAELLQLTDRVLKSFPEVASVYGKAGRAQTATDPAPLEMFEAIVNLTPKDQWRAGVTTDSLIREMDAALRLPGLNNAWTMPIKARTDMLATGIRTPVGIKVYGPDLATIDHAAREVERVVRSVDGAGSAYAERTTGGRYVVIEPDRAALARLGLRIDDLQATVATALGGETVTTTVEGRQRFSVNVRYPRGLRDDPDTIARDVLVSGEGGAMVPLGQVAAVRIESGPPSIRTENAQLATYIYVDLRDRDVGSFVADAKRAVGAEVKLPPGVRLEWSGQYEYLERAAAKLRLIIPVTLGIILLLLYVNFGKLSDALIVMLSVPFALVGGVWLLWALSYQLSVAVAVGFIALAGVAAETGIVMLLYLEQAWAAHRATAEAEGRPATVADLRAAILEGAVERVRPKMMTVAAITLGLLPILWSTGTGSDVMRRIAVPMVGGMFSSTLLTLLVIPAIYALVQGRALTQKVVADRPAHAELFP
jgi:copper/silver efflux system protein